MQIAVNRSENRLELPEQRISGPEFFSMVADNFVCWLSDVLRVPLQTDIYAVFASERAIQLRLISPGSPEEDGLVALVGEILAEELSATWRYNRCMLWSLDNGALTIFPSLIVRARLKNAPGGSLPEQIYRIVRQSGNYPSDGGGRASSPDL